MVRMEDRIIAVLIYGISYFTALIGPIILWLLFRNRSEFVDFHGKQYLNILISFAVYTFIGMVLVLVGIGLIILWILPVISLVMVVVAAIKAFYGEYYRVPGIFRLIRQ